MAKSLKPGAIFVTFTKGLNLPKHFEVLERKRYKMSWGPATVFIHRRLGPDGKSIGSFKLNLLPSDDKSYSDDEDADRRRFITNESDEEDDEDDDDDDYEDEFESEDDGNVGNEEDEDTSADEDDEDDDEDSESSEDYGLGNEQQMNSYAPQRSYYATSASRPSPSQSPSDPYGSTLQVKVNPLTSKLTPLITLMSFRSTKCWCFTAWSWKPPRCGSIKKKKSFSKSTSSWRTLRSWRWHHHDVHVAE